MSLPCFSLSLCSSRTELRCFSNAFEHVTTHKAGGGWMPEKFKQSSRLTEETSKIYFIVNTSKLSYAGLLIISVGCYN